MPNQDPKRLAAEKSVMQKNVRKKKVEELLKTATPLSQLLDQSGIKEQHDWYLGIIEYKIVENQFKKDGDYAVIASEEEDVPKLILVVLEVKKEQKVDRKNIYQIPLTLEKAKWALSSGLSVKLFKTVVELVEYYQKNKFEVFNVSTGLKLVTPCDRPKWLMTHDQLEVETSSILGSGNFCAVFRGKIKRKNLDVAIKICHSEEADDTKLTVQSTEKEVMARNALIKEGVNLHKVHHFNVTSFYGICCDKQPIMIVMELCPGGDLLKHLLAYNDQIQVGERLKYAVEAASGVSHIHKKGIIHRDLAARNCLISKYGTIKIGDFGLSKEMSDNAPDDSTIKQQVPLRWMAPESLQREPKFSDKTDVWAFGMVLYEIFGNGQKPWDDLPNKKVATHIRRCEMPVFPEKAPQEVKNLVKEKIWVLDPLKRCNFDYVKEELTKAQKAHPCPDLQKTTLQKITGVKVLTESEIMKIKKMEGGENHTKEIAGTVASSSKATKKSTTPHILRTVDHQKGSPKEINPNGSRVSPGDQTQFLLNPKPKAHNAPIQKSTTKRKDRN